MVELIIDWILKRGSKFSGQGVGGTKATPGRGVSVSQGWKHQTNLAARMEYNWGARGRGRPGSRAEGTRVAEKSLRLFNVSLGYEQGL